LSFSACSPTLMAHAHANSTNTHAAMHIFVVFCNPFHMQPCTSTCHLLSH
jgi:hypothetical protein